MVERQNSTPTLKIVDAIDSLMSQVRKLHPEVPANIVVAIASGKSKRGSVHGHFAPESWEGGNHEILLSGESLSRGANATLGTLLHELAHAVAHSEGIKDTSNNGRYHNKKFKEIAEKLGIELEQADTIGWSVTTLPDTTAARYTKGLEKLTDALTTWRVQRVAPEAPKPRNKTKFEVKCECEEDSTFTMSIKRYEAHPDMTCNDCFGKIVPVESDEDDDNDGEED